jgi:hypothetical protein
LNHSRHIIWYQSISCDLRQEPKTEEGLLELRLINLTMVGDKGDLLVVQRVMNAQIDVSDEQRENGSCTNVAGPLLIMDRC